MPKHDTSMTDDQAAEAIKAAQAEVDRIEGEIEDLESELHWAEVALEKLKKTYPQQPTPPGPPPLPRVMTFVCDETTWYTDGYRAFPDAWPGEYTPNEGDPGDVARNLVHECEAYMPVVTVQEIAATTDYEVLVYDNGAILRRDWIEAVTAPGGVEVCSIGPLKPAALKDDTGRVLAIQMPILGESTTLKDRRPVATSQASGEPT